MAWCRRRKLRPWVLGYAWEKQWRGVLHIHPLLAYSTLEEKAGADAYRKRLALVTGDYGFGFAQTRNSKVREPSAAAAYLSSYFVTGKRGKMTLQESALSGDMPRNIVYVSRRLSSGSGVTMRSLRQLRHLYVLCREQHRDIVGTIPPGIAAELLELLAPAHSP